MVAVNASRSTQSAVLDWGWAGAALEGDESGDLHVVVALPHGALLAVIDGLGHGPEAADAARTAATILRDDAGFAVQELLERCHEGLRGTRGAVMSLVALDSRSSTIDWFGVGNVEGLLFHVDGAGRRSHQAISARGGVLGYRLPPVKIGTLRVFSGDVLVLASDGIRADFALELPLEWEPQAIADWLLARYGKASDDALVLVARYLGGTP
jgi:negative regulator of sigma-B (phosphoserine phosphatase)